MTKAAISARPPTHVAAAPRARRLRAVPTISPPPQSIATVWGSGQDAYGALGTGRSGQAAVCGQQLASENLGQRDVGRVVGRHVGTELIGAAHESERREPVEVDVSEVIDGCGEPTCGQRAGQPPLP